MCILFFAINQHPKYPVIICANRDEFHQRATQMMHWWPDNDKKNRLLAGKDLQAGGTWLGLNQQGRFSALTNYRQPQLFDETKKSRGDLVINALKATDQAIKSQLTKYAHHYNGFNLVFGQLNQLTCFDSTSQKLQKLTTGFHSLCNGALDDIWPKMARGQNQLAQAITQTITQNITHTITNKKVQIIEKEQLIDQLFSLMQNQQQAEIKSLPNTGLSVDWEQRLSSIFIVSPEYGTRTTNIIIQDNDGNIAIYDRSYDPQGNCSFKQNFLIPLTDI